MTLFLVSFVLFSVALGAAAWYVWQVPQQHRHQALAARLREIRSRTGTARRAGVSDLLIEQKTGSVAFLEQLLHWIRPARRVQELIDQANLRYRAVDVLLVSVVIAAGVYLLLGLLGLSLFLLQLVLAAALGSIPILYILRVRGRRLTKFEELLPDAIDLFNRSMKAGHNIHAGLDTIAVESIDPVKMEFRKVVEELGLGSPIEAALHNLGRRVPLIDLKFFITGLILQRQTGANMVAVLENLSLLIRERLTLAAKLKAATTQQRFSAALLCALPVVVGLGFWFVKPEYIRLLYTDPVGSKFFTYAIVSEILGILIIRKISNPKF